MAALIGFLNGPVGRIARGVLGLALIYVGLAVLGGVLGVVVALVGLAPIALATAGRCALEFLHRPQTARQA